MYVCMYVCTSMCCVAVTVWSSREVWLEGSGVMREGECWVRSEGES